MEHINKQIEVDIDLLEQKNPEPDKKKIMEGINIAILILLGLGGLFIYSNIITQKKSPINFSTITGNAAINEPKKSKAIVPIQKKESRNEILLIKGYKEAGELLAISIEGFDKETKYSINFGDGFSQNANNYIVGHTYQNPGNYTIELTISSPNKADQKIQKKIYIDDAIEVTPNAHIEK